MVRWLNLRSFHGKKSPIQRLADLREALGEVALLIGALQTFAAEVYTAARSRTPVSSSHNYSNRPIPFESNFNFGFATTALHLRVP